MKHIRTHAALLLLLLVVVLTAAAEEAPGRRGCRVGHYRPAGQEALAPARQQRAGSSETSPYIGQRRQLVILASFRDQDFEGGEAEALQMWDRIFNAEDYHEGSYVGSVRDYFSDQSYGLLTLIFDLKYVSLPDSCKKYHSTADDENSQYLVDDIVDVLQNQNLDWSQYDWDGDGYVNQLLIVYAGKGQNAGGSSNTIWPHQWWLSQHLDLTTPAPYDYRSYRTVTYGGREYKIDSYCCVQEVTDYGSTKTSFGTICHEYSHCFGLPDFYYGTSKTVAEWDLMDYGNYGGKGYCPTGYSAHERMLMGWLTPTELTTTATVTDMPALCDAPQAYLIRNDAHADEYYIVENRQQRGWDAALPGSGILVFHVDYDKGIWVGTDEAAPNSASYKRYSIFAANNRTSTSYAKYVAEWPYPYQTGGVVMNDSLTNYSAPAAKLNYANADGQKLMSKPLTKMAVNDGLASFEFMAAPVSAITGCETQTASPQVLYDMGPIQIVRRADGTVRKVRK